MDSNVRKIWIWSFEYAFEIIAIMKQIMLNLQYSFKVQKKSILRRGKIDIRLLSLNCGLSLSQIQWQDFASFGFVRCCYISVLVLTCFHLTKGRATYFLPETIVASFLHLTVLLSKLLLNHSLQRKPLPRFGSLITYSLSWVTDGDVELTEIARRHILTDQQRWPTQMLSEGSTVSLLVF